MSEKDAIEFAMSDGATLTSMMDSTERYFTAVCMGDLAHEYPAYASALALNHPFAMVEASGARKEDQRRQMQKEMRNDAFATIRNGMISA
jgi:glycyl-tRNA synthetase alpha subunit